MNSGHLFMPRVNGNVSFRQTTLKLNDENTLPLKANQNLTKSVTLAVEDSRREFTGKDITNLTVQNGETGRRLSDTLKMRETITNLLMKKGKDDIASRYKNYNLRNRNHTTKTVNEAMVQAKLKEERQIVNNEIIMKSEDEMEEEEEEAIHMSSSEEVFNPRPQLCEEYIPEIFEHLKSVEFDNLPDSQYMKNQGDINEKMRSILIDWLVEVHLKFKLLPETLFLSVNLIDRYLEKRHIMRNRLQLVGVTAMLIACKYEEIYAPEVRDFVYITDKAYTKEEILGMENEMLAALDYNVTVPSSFRYLEVYNYFLKMDESLFTFCRYLLELFLVDYKMLRFNPSLLAATSIYVGVKVTKKADVEQISEITDYSEDKLRECAKDVCLILDNVEKSSLQAVRKKFSLSKFFEVSKIKLV